MKHLQRQCKIICTENHFNKLKFNTVALFTYFLTSYKYKTMACLLSENNCKHDRCLGRVTVRTFSFLLFYEATFFIISFVTGDE